MSTAVHFGAGNIGRGFLGQLYWQSGCDTVFVDVVDAVVAALNERGSYTLQIVDEHCQALAIDRVRAIHGRDVEAVAEAIAACDLASTAVGVRALPHIAAPLATGLARRAERSGEPLNVVVCENLLDAAHALREAVLEATPPAARAFVAERVGFVSTVVSRMVPIVPESVRARDPLYVAVEAYCTLPVDATAFVGAPPAIEGFLPVPNIAAHEERKLFCHNCGHALCAYAGHAKGLTYIAEAVTEPSIRALATGGLAETAQALIARHGFDPAEHQAHVDDLLRRFANRALGDTVARVGRDPIRKLGRHDRLVGAAQLCLDNGVPPRRIIEGIRAALAYDEPGDPEALRLQEMRRGRGLDAVLRDVCGLRPDEELWRRIREVAR
ncbi:MAG TPA: mannitol-1-phosphate 5-dehydrogenase [Planctomycetota bacterium]|nr:mannitol-1-phosphate 5-dehydrogenase [Planctomycetota bacterium]